MPLQPALSPRIRPDFSSPRPRQPAALAAQQPPKIPPRASLSPRQCAQTQRLFFPPSSTPFDRRLPPPLLPLAPALRSALPAPSSRHPSPPTAAPRPPRLQLPARIHWPARTPRRPAASALFRRMTPSATAAFQAAHAPPPALSALYLPPHFLPRQPARNDPAHAPARCAAPRPACALAVVITVDQPTLHRLAQSAAQLLPPRATPDAPPPPAACRVQSQPAPPALPISRPSSQRPRLILEALARVMRLRPLPALCVFNLPAK